MAAKSKADRLKPYSAEGLGRALELAGVHPLELAHHLGFETDSTVRNWLTGRSRPETRRWADIINFLADKSGKDVREIVLAIWSG